MIPVSNTNPGSRYHQNPPPLLAGSKLSLGRFLRRRDDVMVAAVIGVPVRWRGWAEVKTDPLGGGLHLCPQASFSCCVAVALRCLDDAVDAGLVLGAQLGVDSLDRLGAVDELLQTGVQLVVESVSYTHLTLPTNR